MKLDDRLGVMYDTIFFGIIYFNHDRVKRIFENSYATTENLFEYYEQVLKDAPEIPSLLYPFFYSDFTRMSFLIQYMCDYWNFFSDTFEDYAEQLEHDPDVKRNFLLHYLPDEALVDRCFETQDFIPLIPAITGSDLEDRLKFGILNILAEFETSLATLLDIMKKIHIPIENLHTSLYTDSEKLLTEFGMPKYEPLIREFCQMDATVPLKRQLAAISYFNVVVIFYTVYENRYAFILGSQPDGVNSLLTKRVNYTFLDIQDIFTALAHPVKREILESLKEKESTATLLSKQVNVTRQSLNAQLLWLHDLGFVKLSRKEGMEKYYQINDEFIKANLHHEMSQKVYHFLLELLNYDLISFETIMDILAHPVRRELLKLLSESEYTATQLSEIMYVTRQSINNHLLVLHDSMLITLCRKNGPEKYYTINNQALEIAKMLVNNYITDLQLAKENCHITLSS